jgi:hypothetical protein
VSPLQGFGSLGIALPGLMPFAIHLPPFGLGKGSLPKLTDDGGALIGDVELDVGGEGLQ